MSIVSGTCYRADVDTSISGGRDTVETTNEYSMHHCCSSLPFSTTHSHSSTQAHLENVSLASLETQAKETHREEGEPHTFEPSSEIMEYESENQLVNSGLALRCDDEKPPLSTSPSRSKKSFQVTPRSRNPFAKSQYAASTSTSSGLAGVASSSTSIPHKSTTQATPRRVALNVDSTSLSNRKPSPVKALGTPFIQRLDATPPHSEKRVEKKWRLLWRGGLEVGRDDYKLDGKGNIAILFAYRKFQA